MIPQSSTFKLAVQAAAAVRAVYQAAGFPSVSEVWVSRDGFIPICYDSFAVSRHVDTRRSRGSDPECASKTVKVVEVLTGRCAPPPIGAALCTDLGVMPACSDILDDFVPPSPKTVLPSIASDGSIDWSGVQTADSEMDFNKHILFERDLLGNSYLETFHEGFCACYGKTLPLTNFSVLVSPWDEQVYSGHRITVEASI